MGNVFLRAGLLTALSLAAGVLIGFWLDTGRLYEIEGLLTESGVMGADIDMQYRLLQVREPDPASCEAAMTANLDYNDRIYADGRKIEQAEAANRFTPELLLERKRYALQQLSFWTNALAIRQRCNANYTVMMDVWKYDTSSNPSLAIPQRLQSAALLDAKERCGPSLMLSNVPIDLGLTSVGMLIQSYNITGVPALIVNDSDVFYGQDALDAIASIRC